MKKLFHYWKSFLFAVGAAYFAKPLPMPRKSSALKFAPPIRPPSTSSFAKISAAFEGLHEPPYRIAVSSALCAELLGQHLADVGVDLLRLLGRCGLARADGPNGFVCDHELLVLLGGEVVDDLFDLRLHHVEVLAGFTLFEVLAHAVDRRQAVCVSLRHLLVERLGSLAVVLAALQWPRITYLQPSAAIIEAAISPV